MKISEKVRCEYIDRFGNKPGLLLHSPGRVNIIGEHTDYNGGLVLPGAINRYITMAFGFNELRKIRMYAGDLDEFFEMELRDLKPQTSGSFANFLLGVYFEINKIHNIDRGFDLVVMGDIPLGAGLSSSAALTCCMAYALDQALGLNMDRTLLAKIVQDAHHSFVGVKCGMLDQMASLLGKKNRAIHIDCQTLEYRYFPIPSDKMDWFLIDTNVKHDHVSSAYNDRVNTCQGIVDLAKKNNPEITVLSQLSFTELHAIKRNLSDSDYLMGVYILEENQRVLAMEKALETADTAKIGEILYEGHKGLSEKYLVSCPESDFIVELSKSDSNIYGARMMGGGFGGCVICAAKPGSPSEEFFKDINRKYSQQFGFKPTYIDFNLVNGTELI
jgi:galactokinase